MLSRKGASVKAVVQEKSYGPIYGRSVTRIEATMEELVELRKALAIVDKFKKAALRAANTKDTVPNFMVFYDTP
jgi:hypothetical protein